MKACLSGSMHNYTFIKAEDVKPLAPRGGYKDWLTFELAFSELSHLVLLFCEAPGSYAELGAFSVVPEIRERLLVVVDDTAWRKETFVREGPLEYLEIMYPGTAVLVLKTEEVGLGPGSYGVDINLSAFIAKLEPAIISRFKEVRDDRSFNPERTGHLFKLMTGIIQDYGALKEVELRFIMSSIGHAVSDEELDNIFSALQ